MMMKERNEMNPEDPVMEEDLDFNPDDPDLMEDELKDLFLNRATHEIHFESLKLRESLTMISGLRERLSRQNSRQTSPTASPGLDLQRWAWNVPMHVALGSNDNLQTREETLSNFVHMNWEDALKKVARKYSDPDSPQLKAQNDEHVVIDDDEELDFNSIAMREL